VCNKKKLNKKRAKAENKAVFQSNQSIGDGAATTLALVPPSGKVGGYESDE